MQQYLDIKEEHKDEILFFRLGDFYEMTLAHGGEGFYDGWMKNPKSAMISCNDGFRPVSFLLETVEDE